MATRLTSDTDERVVEDLVSRHPLKRLLIPEEVAEAVCLRGTPAKPNQ